MPPLPAKNFQTADRKHQLFQASPANSFNLLPKIHFFSISPKRPAGFDGFLRDKSLR